MSGDRLSAEQEQEIRKRWADGGISAAYGEAPYDVSELLAELDVVRADLTRWLAWSGGDYPDTSPGDVIAWEVDGTITLDDSITTWNPLRALVKARAELAQARKERDEAVRDAVSAREKMHHNAANLDFAIQQRSEAEAALAAARETLERIAHRSCSGDCRYEAREALSGGGGDPA